MHVSYSKFPTPFDATSDLIMKTRLLLISILFWVVVAPLYADTETALVDSIMKLRADVEGLYSQLQEKKENHRAQMKSFAMQKADLESQINRQDTAFKKLHLDVENTRKQMLEASSKNKDLKPLLLAALSSLMQDVERGLPFKKSARMADLEKLRSRIEAGTITPERGLSQVWASYEDALRLTRENGVFKQEIELDGQSHLSDVAKLGSVMMFFRTPDDRLGYVEKSGDGYNYHISESEEEQRQISTLFDAIKKQIRSGYFHLPNALVLREESK